MTFLLKTIGWLVYPFKEIWEWYMKDNDAPLYLHLINTALLIMLILCLVLQ